MSRSKLLKLGINLPAFPATSVGSFPKPSYLVKARADYARGAITPEELKEAERRAIKFWVQKQEDLGLDVLVDGEMYRGDMVAYFADQLSGFEQGGLVRSYGNRYYHKPIIVNEVKWTTPITVEWWRYAQSLTSRPVKGILTGAYTLMDWSFNEFYSTRRDACLALAKEVRKEAEALVRAGCKIIQIDEPAISVRPAELPLAIEAMGMTTRELEAYFLTHICYGDFQSIYPGMLDLAVDNFDLEMSNSGLDMLQLFSKAPFTKDISYGVVDVHTHVIEDLAVAEQRLKKGLELLAPETIWVDPDCGLKTRTVEEAEAKLERVVSAARALRGN
ncbi:MAG: methionine synthase [Acidobacteria bacterium]|nr:MAG: methionine synthase [Acidobacteriota bacterium]